MTANHLEHKIATFPGSPGRGGRRRPNSDEGEVTNRPTLRHWSRDLRVPASPLTCAGGIARGRLDPGLSFSSSWIRGGELSASINVRTETDAVVLMYRARSWGDAEWKAGVADPDHLDRVPLRRPPSLVRLFRFAWWTVLWTPRCRAVQRG